MTWTGQPRGEEHYCAKLDRDAVREIYLSDAPRYVFAERYGVAPHTISDIRCEKTWRHVTRHLERDAATTSQTERQ